MKKKIVIVLLLSFSCFLIYSQGSEPVVLISGKVVNERTMEPLEARVIYEILPGGAEAGIARTDPATGEYKIILPRGKSYGYRGYAEGFYSVTKYCDVSDLKEYTEIEEQNLFMAPLKEEQLVRLNNIFFKKKSAELKDESTPELNRFLEFMKINKKLVIEIQGHTDNQGNPNENLTLSKSRAQAIADFLIANGIKAERMEVVGYGQSRPIGFNQEAEGREMNRRIEFRIINIGKK